MKTLPTTILLTAVIIRFSFSVCCADQITQQMVSPSATKGGGPPQRPYYLTGNTMIKDANDRLRPFVQHPTLVIPLFTTGDFSYPSGHASGMELQARILAELFPKKREALLQRARQIADGRVVAAVHYASDTEAGLTLGDLLFTELEAKSKFLQDLSAAAAEDIK